MFIYLLNFRSWIKKPQNPQNHRVEATAAIGRSISRLAQDHADLSWDGSLAGASSGERRHQCCCLYRHVPKGWPILRIYIYIMMILEILVLNAKVYIIICLGYSMIDSNFISTLKILYPLNRYDTVSTSNLVTKKTWLKTNNHSHPTHPFELLHPRVFRNNRRWGHSYAGVGHHGWTYPTATTGAMLLLLLGKMQVSKSLDSEFVFLVRSI